MDGGPATRSESEIPYFSVIVNNYNYGRFLREALDSVLEQTFGDFQLIVVDDGSTDDSRDIIQGYDDPRIVPVLKENGGQLSCFNAAIPHVNGRVVCFLDADDAYQPDYLRTIREVYEQGGCDSVFCNVRFFGAREDLLHQEKMRVLVRESYYLARYSEKFWQGPTSSLSMRAEMFRSVLPLPQLDGDWAICADIVLALGVSLHRGAICYIPDVLVRYRVHDSNAIFNQRLDKKAAAARKKREREAAMRYQACFPGSGMLLDFGRVVRELLASPIPLAYKPLMGRRLWVFGRLLCKIAARGKQNPRFAYM